MTEIAIFMIGWILGQLFIAFLLIRLFGNGRRGEQNVPPFENYPERIPPDFISWVNKVLSHVL